jgi:HK97 family phage portal protein
MGFIDWLLGPDERARVQPPVSNVAELIHELLTERLEGFSVAEAMRMPAVARGVQLICSTGAMFTPLMYRDGAPAAIQPRIVTRPSPFQTRYEYVYQTLLSLVQHGNAYWLLGDRDAEGYPRTSIVLDPDEVMVAWDERRLQEQITWRNRRLVPGFDVMHIALGRAAGDVLGRSPIREGLPALSTIAAAEEYAASFFTSGGLPSTILRSSSALTADEAAALKAQWITANKGPARAPAVLSGGIDAEFPSTDPQKSQLQETRAYGATIVARMLGIPAPLLHVETSGATITYGNAQAAFDEFIRGTLSPAYLHLIEAAWSDLVPSTSSVRFDTRELMRVDTVTRMGVYATALGAGILTTDEVRRLEGWPVDIQMGTLYAPTPQPAGLAADFVPEA